MDGDQQTLQIQNGAFETLVPGFGIHATGVAKFERGQGSVIFERLPNNSSVVTDAARAIKTGEIAGSDRRFVHGEKIRQLLERDKGTATSKIFSVVGQTAAGQLVLPAPNHRRILVPNPVFMRLPAGHGMVERGEGYVLGCEQHAESAGIDVSNRCGEGEDWGLARSFVVGFRGFDL